MKRRQRQASHKKDYPNAAEDKQGGGLHLPHRVNPETGMYRGRQVLTIKSDD
jgi:large subunit ribosomal protein L32